MSALERIQAAADRISARLDEKALKRVERFLGVWGDVPRDVSGTHHEVTGRWTSLRVADVRAVLALAKEAAELKRRIRWAKRMLLAAAGPIVTGTTAWRLLDLRRPLPKRRRG